MKKTNKQTKIGNISVQWPTTSWQYSIEIFSYSESSSINSNGLMSGPNMFKLSSAIRVFVLIGHRENTRKIMY